MKYKKENLVKLINLIEEISIQQGNDWFLESLQNKFSKKNIDNNSNEQSLEAKINLIKDYLSIDLKRVIDYSKFDEPAKESLFRDCIEMGRYEKGTPNHKIDFGEFCRYAHLQCEEMINYFLNKISNQKIEIIDHFIREKVHKYTSTKIPTEIHHINYTYKLTAFKSISNLSKNAIAVFWFLNEYRNELSHRNSLSTPSEDYDLALYKNEGFINAFVDFQKLDFRQIKIYNRGKYIITKRNKDFNLIYNSIEELKIQIIETLSKIKELPSFNSTFGNKNNVSE
jgi:hypothetical protein